MPRNLARARPLSDAEVAKFKAAVQVCIDKRPSLPQVVANRFKALSSIELEDQLKRGKSIRQIAMIFGVSRGSIYRRLRILGMPTHYDRMRHIRSKQWTPAHV